MPDARRYISAINAATRRPIRQAECHADKLQGTFGRPKEVELVTRAKLFYATIRDVIGVSETTGGQLRKLQKAVNAVLEEAVSRVFALRR
jgi:hypothetical protein